VPIPFRVELQALFDEFAEHHRGVRLGRMFGLPAIFAGRRLVACLMEDGLIVRLPADMARREIEERAEPFSRKGRPLDSWVMYRPRTIVDARRLSPVLEVAARYVAMRQAEALTGVKIAKRR
jgi:hypothetical protein